MIETAAWKVSKKYCQGKIQNEYNVHMKKGDKYDIRGDKEDS